MQNVMLVIRENMWWFVGGIVVLFLVPGSLFGALFLGYGLALVGYRRRRDEPLMFIHRSALLTGVLIFGLNLLFGYPPAYAIANAGVWGVASGLVVGNGIRLRGL